MRNAVVTPPHPFLPPPSRSSAHDCSARGLPIKMHYAFFNDFVFSKLLPSDDAQLMTVLDVGELRLATIKNNTVVTK